MNKQELINHIKDQDEWSGNHRFILIKKEELISMIEDLDQLQKVKVPEEFDEWYQQIKLRWHDELSAKEFALWKICQFGFSHGFKDVRNNRTSRALSTWVSTHREDAINAIWNGYEVEEDLKWVVNDGDLVIHRGEHGAKVYFVESVDEDGILLVNGIKDEFFTDMPERAVGDESVSYFYKNFRLLARKENLEVEKV